METPVARTEAIVLSAMPDEREVLRRARAGDADAFRQLVVRHQAMVHALAVELAGEGDKAAHLALAAFAALDAALPRIHGPSHLQRCVLRAVVQLWLASQPAHAEAPSRAAVLLHLQAGMEIDDIAAVLWRTPGEMAAQLHDAVERLAADAGMNASDFARQVRAQGSVADPGPEFTARVMARRELRWTHRRRAIGGAGVRRHRRGMVAGIIAAVCIAVIVLALRWPWSMPPPDAGRATPAQERAPSGAAPATHRESSTPPAAQAGTDAGPPTARDLYRRYTVLAMPLRQANIDAEARAAVEAFHAALLEEMRRVPGLVLLEPGISSPPPDADQPADFLLTVAGLAAGDAAGTAGFRVNEAGGLLSPLPGSLPTGVVALPGVDPARSGPGAARQWPVQLRIQPIDQPASASFTSAFQVGAEPAAQLAARQVALLRLRVFPDAATRQQLVMRIRDASLPEAERSRALSDLLATSLRGRGQALDAASIDALVEHAALLDAGQRAQLWRSLRGTPHPDLVEPLLDYARRDADAQVRLEAVATLAANHHAEARVRAALESAAGDDADPLVRLAARRALDGEEAWRGEVLRALNDRQQDDDARLAPLLAAARSASTPDELRSLRTLVADAGVRNILADMVREGWFDPLQSGAVADAMELLGSAGNPAAFDLSVQLLQDARAVSPAVAAPVAPPEVATSTQLSAAQMAWLVAHRDNPRARRILDDIARGNRDPRWPALVEQMQRMERLPRAPPRQR